MKLEISSRQRSKKVLMTNEARVLKRLRKERGLSLREVAQKLGKSHSTIANIEGGRMDVPKGERLMELLTVYGIDNYRAFYHKVRNYSEQADPRNELRELIERLDPERVQIALEILKQVAGGRRIIAV